MKQFMDIFSLPEMTLLSCVNEYFLKNNIDYEPVHLYKDVKVLTLSEIHGYLHNYAVLLCQLKDVSALFGSALQN